MVLAVQGLREACGCPLLCSAPLCCPLSGEGRPNADVPPLAIESGRPSQCPALPTQACHKEIRGCSRQAFLYIAAQTAVGWEVALGKSVRTL